MRCTVSEDTQGHRLDIFVAKQLSSLSRSSASKLIEQHKVKVNGDYEKPSYKLRVRDIVAINFDENELKIVPKIKVPTIYEDEDCLVLDKPMGVLTHSKGAFNPEGTIATFIAPKLKDLSGERAGIVHRLDRATSGVIIAAKHPEALKWLQKQFSQRRTKKTYIAVVEKLVTPEAAIIDVPIERHPKRPQTFRAGVGGKDAITAYKILKSSDVYSLVELVPQTGRTHQLRVHMKHLGHPIVGDTLYDGEPAGRLYLHAHKLELTLPNKERKVFTSAIPPSFRAIMK